MQEYVGLLIAAARRRIKQVVLARAAAHGLTVQQFWFLVALRERPGMSQAELAAYVRSDAPTVSRVLTALARRRLVHVEPDPGDRRRTIVRLTASGARLGAEAAATATEIRDGIVAGMTATEIAGLRSALQRVIANVDRWEQRRSAPADARPRSRAGRHGGRSA